MKFSKRFKRKVKKRLLITLFLLALIVNCCAIVKILGKTDTFQETEKVSFVGESENLNQENNNNNGSEKADISLMSVNSNSTQIIENAQVASGNTFEVALKTDGTVWTWGNNQYGQQGNGTIENVNRAEPGQVIGVNGEGYLENIKQITTGAHFTVREFIKD